MRPRVQGPYFEPINSLELLEIQGGQRSRVSDRGGCDDQIVRPDHLTPPNQFGPELCMHSGNSQVEGKYIQRRKYRSNEILSFPPPFLRLRTVITVQEFRH